MFGNLLTWLKRLLSVRDLGEFMSIVAFCSGLYNLLYSYTELATWGEIYRFIYERLNRKLKTFFSPVTELLKLSLPFIYWFMRLQIVST